MDCFSCVGLILSVRHFHNAKVVKMTHTMMYLDSNEGGGGGSGLVRQLKVAKMTHAKIHHHSKAIRKARESSIRWGI